MGKLKNLIRILKTQPKTLVILATEVNIPIELNDLITFVEFTLPTDIEIRNELKRLFTSLGQTVEPDFLEILVRSCHIGMDPVSTFFVIFALHCPLCQIRAACFIVGVVVVVASSCELGTAPFPCLMALACTK